MKKTGYILKIEEKFTNNELEIPIYSPKDKDFVNKTLLSSIDDYTLAFENELQFINFYKGELNKIGITNLKMCRAFITNVSKATELKPLFQKYRILYLFLDKYKKVVSETYFNDFFREFLMLIKQPMIYRHFSENYNDINLNKFQFLNSFLKSRIDEYVYKRYGSNEEKEVLGDLKKELRRYKAIRGVIAGFIDYNNKYNKTLLSEFEILVDNLDIEYYVPEKKKFPIEEIENLYNVYTLEELENEGILADINSTNKIKTL